MKRDLQKILSFTKKTETGCLEWTRCFNTDGYPRAAIDGHFNGKVHRIIYELIHPEENILGKHIRHTCDNPKCINPSHLLSGTPTENVNDRDIRDRHGWTKIRHKDIPIIKELYSTKTYTANELAHMYNVTNRTIYYTLNKRKVGI